MLLFYIFFPQNFKVEVLGVDLSKNMIDIGKQRAQEFKDDKVMYMFMYFWVEQRHSTVV